MPRGSKPAPGPLALRVAAILDAESKAQGLSQPKLEAITGISQSNLSLYLNGKRTLDVDQLQALCDALGLNIEDVVSRASGPAA